MRDGVSPSCIAMPPQWRSAVRWPTLLDFLVDRMPSVGRTGWQQRMAAGEVLNEQGQPVGPTDAFQGGGRLYYWRTLADEPVIPFEAHVLFEDTHLLVVDKPHFLPVTPSGRFVRQSLLVRLKQTRGIETLSPIHRIDRETAGLVLLSLRPQDRAAYHAMFRQQVVDKTYEAIAPFEPKLTRPKRYQSRLIEDPDAFYRMIEVDGAPNSETTIELLEPRGHWARYRLNPRTGKRHQLRVHMAALGLPLLGDQFYPHVQRGPQETEDFTNPLRLLARAIAFTDPVTGQSRRFESRRHLDWPPL